MPETNPFDETVSDLSGITVTCNETTGDLVITGVSAREMRSILTAASLHRSDNDKPTYIAPDTELREIDEANARQAQAWRFAQRDLIDFLDTAILRSYAGQTPDPVEKIASERRRRRLLPEPAWTDVPPPVDPQAEARAELKKLVSDAQQKLNEAASLLRR